MADLLRRAGAPAGIWGRKAARIHERPLGGWMVGAGSASLPLLEWEQLDLPLERVHRVEVPRLVRIHEDAASIEGWPPVERTDESDHWRPSMSPPCKIWFAGYLVRAVGFARSQARRRARDRIAPPRDGWYGTPE